MSKGVYKITNLINNKIYIGSTLVDFDKRWKHHISALNKNKHHSPHLQNAYNKYGKENFKFEILHIMDNNSEEEILKTEEKYILKYKSYLSEYGYNISTTPGGGSSRNKPIAVYDKNGKFIEILSSRNKTIAKYKFSGVATNMHKNKGISKYISKIGYIFVMIDGNINYDIQKYIVNNENSENDVLIYDIKTKKIIKNLGTRKQFKKYCIENNINEYRTIEKANKMNIIYGTDAWVYTYRKNIFKIQEIHKDLKLLCVFNKDGDFISSHLSKTFTAKHYKLKPQSINSCSKSNNNGEYKWHYRTYNNYIFKHFKLSEIPKNIYNY